MVGATYAAMTRTSQFQRRQQLELNREAYGDVSTRAKLRDRIWKDLNFHEESFGLTTEEKKAIVNQLARHKPALALEYDDLGLVKDIKINIDTRDAEPISYKCRPLAPHLRKPLKEQIEKWLSQGVVTPCDGPWASPIVAVPKKNGGWRFCADYRALNAVTKRDSRPVANLEEKLARIRGDPNKPMKYYASLDLSEAYHSVELAEEDQDKSAIITPLGLYKFIRMSFGLKAAPAAFHMVVKKIEEVMERRDPEVAESILLYFDDALIIAESFEELQRKMEVFLNALEEVGMKIQPRKANFGQRRVKWLGHEITEEGIFPDRDRMKVLKEWPIPKNKTGAVGIHGLMSTFRKWVRNFAARTSELRKLITRGKDSKKTDPVEWTDKCQQQFNEVCDLLEKSPKLGHPDFSEDAAPFIITVDTSKQGMGCTLSQEQMVPSHEDPKKKVKEEVIIFFGSRRLSEGESRYSAYKLELVGLVYALNHFRFYLLGKKFLVRTDHKALEWLRKTKNKMTPHLCYRWQSLLTEFDFEI